MVKTLLGLQRKSTKYDFGAYKSLLLFERDINDTATRIVRIVRSNIAFRKFC